MNDLASVLASTPLCRDLDADEVQTVLDGGRVERWAADATVLEEGAVDPRLLVLLEGRVGVYKRDRAGQDHHIADIGPGGVIGEMSLLLPNQPRTATVRALEPLRAFTMERGRFQELVAAGDPAALKMSVALARALAGRLLAMSSRVVDLLGEVEASGAVDRFARINEDVASRWDF